MTLTTTPTTRPSSSTRTTSYGSSREPTPLPIRGDPLADGQPVTMSIGADYYFGADSIALRATFGFGAKIADTQRVVKLTVAASDS
jgi:hypothetical protein